MGTNRALEMGIQGLYQLARRLRRCSIPAFHAISARSDDDRSVSRGSQSSADRELHLDPNLAARRKCRPAGLVQEITMM